MFVYGSLVDPSTLDDVLDHPYLGRRLAARLDGYRRIALDTYSFPFIVAKPGGFVDGLLLVDLTMHDVQALDLYEEVEALVYRRQVVEVEVRAGEQRKARIQAHTYVGGPALVASIRE